MKKSWQVTWENKGLWWFGLLASLGGGINLSIPFNDGNFQNNIADKQELRANVMDFFSQYSSWIIAGLVAIFGLFIFFSILKIFGRIGLIKLVDDVMKGKKEGFKKGMEEGKVFFWRIFFADVLLGLFIFGIAVVLFLPVGYLFYLESLPAALLSLFLAAVIFIALMTLVSVMRSYIYIYIILGKISVREAVENAYKIFSENIFSSVIMMLVLLVAGILFGAAVAGVIFGTVLVAALLGGVFFLIFGKAGIAGALVIGFIAAVPIFLLIRSVQETFCQVAWILFFREISGVNEGGKIEEAQQEVIGEKIPGTEAV